MVNSEAMQCTWLVRPGDQDVLAAHSGGQRAGELCGAGDVDPEAVRPTRGARAGRQRGDCLREGVGLVGLLAEVDGAAQTEVVENGGELLGVGREPLNVEEVDGTAEACHQGVDEGVVACDRRRVLEWGVGGVERRQTPSSRAHTVGTQRVSPILPRAAGFAS